MPDFITMGELRSISSKLDRSRILTAASRSTAGKSVFLSHSAKDNDLLPAVVHILENHGASVYVDTNDNRLPERPSEQTGQILRETIDACRKLVVFVTTNSNNSRWIPWELGIGDGKKSAWHVCFFPSADKAYEQDWAGVEYLGLYDRIVWGPLQGHEKPLWMVLDHKANTAVELSQWLAR